MDEEDIDYFHEDIKKVDKIEHCKFQTCNICKVVMEIHSVLVYVYGGQISQSIIQNLLQHFAATLTNLKGAADYEICKSALLML
jgi:hypothetical protein